MIRGLLAFVIWVHVAGFEVVLLARIGPSFVPDLAAIAVVASMVDGAESRLFVRFAAIALVRSTLLPGSFIFWLWALVTGWWVARPLGRRFFADRLPFRVLASFSLAVAYSLLQSAVLAKGAGDPLQRTWSAWILTALLAPLVLGAVRGFQGIERTKVARRGQA